ncbi:GATA zinc finger-domain-containing protein [Phascolomyces articulosus]|uniref:GATA zinc finger-domain-containing protein n=1 Tax=Phascolomyces articulosus TaxID=60185 RepID=A0AAD5PFA1_9FUNG|nr:GATA zinc finger-domain-containing protein [Phascolomyces articulosus]
MMTTAQPTVDAPQTIKAPEFTRRKNWSQSILDELRDLVLVITASEHTVVYCSPASSECLGYEPSEIVNHRFTEFVHVDDVDSLTRNLRASKDSMETLKAVFRLQGKDAKYNVVEMTGHFYKNCFFGTARVIPVQATRTMEAFLEIKMENEALKQVLHELQAEKQQMEDEEGQLLEEEVIATAIAPYVYTPGINTSYDITEALSLFTGLHYELGERSRGISMGMEGELLNISPERLAELPAVVGPVDKEIVPAEEMQQRKNKKKRVEVEPPQQRVCTDCGTTDSPEWRKGPNGPKTLCNACGIRFAKLAKKDRT